MDDSETTKDFGASFEPSSSNKNMSIIEIDSSQASDYSGTNVIAATESGPNSNIVIEPVVEIDSSPANDDGSRTTTAVTASAEPKSISCHESVVETDSLQANGNGETTAAVTASADPKQISCNKPVDKKNSSQANDNGGTNVIEATESGPNSSIVIELVRTTKPVVASAEPKSINCHESVVETDSLQSNGNSEANAGVITSIELISSKKKRFSR